jgi:CheY-like chemotaxis protein
MSLHDASRLAKPARVLVVEDDDVLCTLYRSAFDFENLELGFVADGADAMQRIRSWRPALIVLDIDIPSLCGWEVLARLRRDAECPPIVVASAFAEPQQAQQMGAAACFVKPFRLSSLRDACLEILQRGERGRPAGRSAYVSSPPPA